jgi:hypothetical protein
MIIPLNLPILPPTSPDQSELAEKEEISLTICPFLFSMFLPFQLAQLVPILSGLANQHIGFCALFVPDESLAVIFLLRKP